MGPETEQRGQGPEQFRAERDLLLRILDLGTIEAIGPFLKDTLRLLVEVSGAKKAYLEVFDGSHGEPAAWSSSSGCSEEDLESLQDGVSRGIIDETLRLNGLLRTVCAREDDRFRHRASVQRDRIEAVLCTPVGVPAIGVIYLAGQFGEGAFAPNVERMVELVARHAAPFVEGLAARHRLEAAADHTIPWRRKLILDGIVGRSRALAGVFEAIDSVVRFNTNVLFAGPSGSGKTALARALALNSRRALAPFIHVNCGQIPENLIATELFGSVPGAYTGAAPYARAGKVEEAEGGTLFLDEVTTLPVAAQAALLQVLDNGTYSNVGSTEMKKADVRVISATNARMDDEIKGGRFRQDLYYRLAEVAIPIPALAERVEDIEPLCHHFSKAFAEEESRIARVYMSHEAVAAAETATWPGNVRELASAVRVAVLRAHQGRETIVRPQHLFPGAASDAAGDRLNFRDATRRHQRRLLEEALDEAAGNKTRACALLGLSRAHFYNLLDQHGLRDGQ